MKEKNMKKINFQDLQKQKWIKKKLEKLKKDFNKIL